MEQAAMIDAAEDPDHAGQATLDGTAAAISANSVGPASGSGRDELVLAWGDWTIAVAGRIWWAWRPDSRSDLLAASSAEKLNRGIRAVHEMEEVAW
jgi:hypothetical protein